MKWSLGMEIGCNSLGWWAYEIDEKGDIVASLDGGVRLFPDGREPSSPGHIGDSKALIRRRARRARRNREHRKLRIRALVRLLIQNGLLPENAEARQHVIERINPYEARAKAAEARTEPHILGRALFSLGQRRGYQSNRRDRSEQDGGQLKARMAALAAALDGKTLGTFLWDRFQQENNVPRPPENSLRKPPTSIRFTDDSPFYASRTVYAEELATIRKVQGNTIISPVMWDQLALYILEQRPLKPVERGKCRLFPDEDRHWADTPIAQEYRLCRELDRLRVINPDHSSTRLTAEQYEAIFRKLATQMSVRFSVLRKLTDAAGKRLFEAESRFNLESESRKTMTGNRLTVRLENTPLLASFLEDPSAAVRLDDIFTLLHSAETDAEAINALRHHHHLSRKEATAFAQLELSRAPASLSRKAMERLIRAMRKDRQAYERAVVEIIGEEVPSISGIPGQPLYTRLPYYGAVMPDRMQHANPAAHDPQHAPEGYFGRINNPDMHVMLNQLRQLVNGLTDRFGMAPEEIRFALSQPLKQSPKKRQETERRQAHHKKRDAEIQALLAARFGLFDARYADIRKYRLWEELGPQQEARHCPYTGERIPPDRLFSPEVEILHILPFSRSLDDSMANLTLSFARVRPLKGNRTPYDAFADNGHAHSGIIWSDILRRVAILPDYKRWRFADKLPAELMKEDSALYHQYAATDDMSRITAAYLSRLDGLSDVHAIPDRLTPLLRHAWRLRDMLPPDGPELQTDLRHHAIKAAIIGRLDQQMLLEISRRSAQKSLTQAPVAIPPLERHLKTAIRKCAPAILPSFRPDHSLNGKIHKETAYGFTPVAGELVTRKKITTLNAREVRAIRDTTLRMKLLSFLDNYPGRTLQENLTAFGETEGIRSLRIIVPDKTVTPIASAPYKGYSRSGYICCDIWKLPPGKKGGKAKFTGRFHSPADVRNGKIDKQQAKPHPAARFITRLFKNDLLQVGTGKDAVIYRVAGFSTTNNKLDLASPVIARSPQHHVSINVIGPRGLARLHVTVDGRILHKGRNNADGIRRATSPAKKKQARR